MIAGITLVAMISHFVLFDIDTKTEHQFIDRSFLGSTECIVSGIGLIVSTCPTILDVIMDIFSVSPNLNWRHCLVGRMIISVTILMIGIQYALGNVFLADWKDCAASYEFSKYGRMIVYGAALMFCTHILKPSVCTLPQTLFMTSIICLFSLSKFYGFIFENEFLTFFGDNLIKIFIATNVSLCLWWCRKFWQSKTWSTDDYSCLFYIMLNTAHLLFGVIVILSLKVYIAVIPDNSILPQILSHNYLNLLAPIWIHIVAMVILNIIPGRIARLDANASYAKDRILETKKSYTRYISHELRTPMSVIKMGLKFFKTQLCHSTNDELELTKDEQEQLDTLAEMDASSDVAIEILNDLLLYDKLENGLVELHKQDIGALEFIQNSLLMFAVQIRAKKVDLRLMNVNSIEDSMVETEENCDMSGVSVIPKSPTTFSRMFPKNSSTEPMIETDAFVNETDTLFIDKAKIGQVIRNIMSNAIKFTPDNGQIKVTITFVADPCNVEDASATHCKGILVLQIKDNGAGMSQANQSKLFSHIIQFNPEVLQGGGGSGLGLYISKTIVDLHGGKLSVSSEGEGKGSVFRLEIPMVRNKAVSLSTVEFSCVNDIHTTVSEVESLPQKGGIHTDITTINNSAHISGETVDAAAAVDDHIRNMHKQTTCSLELRVDKNCEKSENSVLLDDVSVSDFVDKSSDSADFPKCKLRILVVDDTRSIRKLTMKALQLHGHHCDEAENGKIALEMVEKNMKKSVEHPDDIDMSDMLNRVYDAILTDWVMPEMDGLESTKLIRALGYKGHIVGISGNALEEDRDSFLKAGASHVFVKPLDMDLLIETLHI